MNFDENINRLQWYAENRDEIEELIDERPPRRKGDLQEWVDRYKSVIARKLNENNE